MDNGTFDFDFDQYEACLRKSEISALAAAHAESANDHFNIASAAINFALNVASPGATHYAAVSDPQILDPMSVLNHAMTCTGSIAVQGEGPFQIHTYGFDRGIYATPGSYTLAADLLGWSDDEGSHGSPITVIRGVLGAAQWTVTRVGEDSHEVAEFFDDTKPSIVPGTATIYNVTTVSAYELSVQLALRYISATDGQERLVSRGSVTAEVLLEHCEEGSLAPAWILTLAPIQHAIREAVEATCDDSTWE